jgi:hypothetical protein
MRGRISAWFCRHTRALTCSTIAILLGVIGVETFLLYQQAGANRQVELESARLLDKFLQQDTVSTVSASGVPIRLANVRFHWSEKVYIDTANLAVRATPVDGAVVNFDDLDSFVMAIEESEVRIRTKVLEGMFNESVFNYPGSKLRDLALSIKDDEGERVLHLKGRIRTFLWMPFKMDARLRVDRATNTLVMEGSHVRLLGFIPITKIIRFEPLQLENMLSLPPNRSLMLDANRMMIKPFGLFPPPRVSGRMADVAIDADGIRLTFSGRKIPAPEVNARNYVYLKGGASQFGSFRMLRTDILIVDQDPGDSFVFSLKDYAGMVPASRIEVNDTHSARVTMPDFGGAPRAAAQPAVVSVAR